jgi:dephospho-CoA kinase
MPFTLFGLTGGIACGKSTVARFLRERGLPVIDADSVARDVVAPGTQTLVEITRAFGVEVLSDDGSVDRAKLASIVFANPDARRQLESITHPPIRLRTQEMAQELAAQGVPLAAYEAALLVENGLAEAFRPLVVVTVDAETQVARLIERDRITEAQARSRVAAQMPVADKVAVADHVIDTRGSIEDVRLRTDDVLRGICVSRDVAVGRYGLVG